MKKKLVCIFSRFPKVFRTRDVTITLDRTRHYARPLLLVISRLFIEARDSVT